MGELQDFANRMATFHDRIADQVPQIKRGMVWCISCGGSQKVNGADALRHGWPKCCGATMTIDSPDERRALASRKEAE